MRFKIISVGRKQADPTTPLVDDYLARIGRHIPVEAILLKPGNDSKTIEQMRKASAKSDLRVALDESGKAYDSRKFARLIASWMSGGRREVAFFIGGADGLPEPVLERASLRLSLSKMTLPHRIARLVLAEQLYRGLSIIHGAPYQK